MKVFISWSGTTSHLVAKVLRDWLPNVLQTITPYVSSEDIQKGGRWSADIAGELDSSSYGIICLTKQNITAPWINFEAGALGKSVEKSNVSPFLFRMQPSDVSGPITQFQSTKTDKEDVLKLLLSLNTSCKEHALDAARLSTIYDVWWPKLEESLNKIPEEKTEPSLETRSTKFANDDKNTKILEELLDLSRMTNQIVKDNGAAIPKNISSRFRDLNRDDQVLVSKEAIRDIERAYDSLILLSKSIDLFDESSESAQIQNVNSDLTRIIIDFKAPVRHFLRQVYSGRKVDIAPE